MVCDVVMCCFAHLLVHLVLVRFHLFLCFSFFPNIFRFENYSIVFTTLVVFSGSAHSSLSVVSSNVFGLEFLDCGLTHYELRRLSSFKIYTSVLLENVPQLIFSAIYLSEVGLTPNVMYSSLASLLSVFAVVLSFCIDRDDRDLDIIAEQYFLALESNREDATSETGMTESEERTVQYYSGFREKLSRQLAQLWHVSHKNFQIGKTVLTKNGSITHIVQWMNTEDEADYAAEFCSDEQVMRTLAF